MALAIFVPRWLHPHLMDVRLAWFSCPFRGLWSSLPTLFNVNLFASLLFGSFQRRFCGFSCLLFELKSGRVKLQQVARLPHLVCTFFVTGHWCFYAQSFCSSVRFLYPYIRAQILSIIESLCEYVPGQEAASQQAESQQGGLASSLASGPHACACGGGCVCVGVCGGLWGCVGVCGGVGVCEVGMCECEKP